ncbi:MAG TPA: prepilin-type N-terminal cleavage/methylation domain-containing protein [Anaerovoracaceae bacterium]|nr:prepilin-type N-terminal cleavage/methylation domain-containing protein [Anaerovoracaceae bacterium]
MINNQVKLSDQKKLWNQKGFTLVELIVTMGLLMLIISLIYSFFLISNNFGKMNSDKADAQAQSRLIFEGLKKEVATAKTGFLVIATSDSPENILGLIKDGEYAYFVYNGVYSKMNFAGEIEPAFGNLGLDTIAVSYEVVADTGFNNKLLRVIILANDITLETEIYSPNSGITEAGGQTKNVLILKTAI